MTTANNIESKGFQHAHHFRSKEHQYDTAKVGIWLFMATEILMFGGLFVGFFIFKPVYYDVYAVSSQMLDWKLGGLNTLVLITSSFTMALSIYYIQIGKNNRATLNLAITFICALLFMCIKFVEYSHKFHDQLLPGKNFNNALVVEQLNKRAVYYKENETPAYMKTEESLRKVTPLFFGIYFTMTGLHGVHVVVGAILIFWLMIKTNRGDFSPEYYTPVEGVGIFWHIVDLIWIYLFPLLYLVN